MTPIHLPGRAMRRRRAAAAAAAAALLLLLAATALPPAAAEGHFVRLTVLAAAGLAGLYMMHLLAKDWNNYNKITQKPSAARLLFKRHARLQAASNSPRRGQAEAALLAATRTKLRRAEQYDTKGCARRLVCQLAALPRHRLQAYQDDLLLMIWKSNLGSQHDGFQLAADLGYQTRNQSACYDFFNQCPFPTTQLLNVVQLPSVAYSSNMLAA